MVNFAFTRDYTRLRNVCVYLTTICCVNDVNFVFFLCVNVCLCGVYAISSTKHISFLYGGSIVWCISHRR